MRHCRCPIRMHAAAVFFLAVAALLLPIKSNVAADKPAGAVPRTPLEIGGSFKVRVVDDRGEPLAGCNVIATGLRSDPDRAHYRWVPSRHGPRPFTETDRQGIAKLSYPAWIDKDRDLQTASVTVIADHPEFCTSLQVTCSFGGDGITVIRLDRGGRLRLHAFRGNGKKPLTDFRTMVSGNWDSYRPWPKTTKGAVGRISPALTVGTKLIRIVHAGEDGTLFFSRLLKFESRAGHTEDRLLRLRPGMTVEGRLDQSVPRPVRDGYAVLVVADEIPLGKRRVEDLDWQAWTRVSPDGEFHFEQLPPSNEVRVLAWCDGYVSADSPAEAIPDHLRQRRGYVGLPQFIQLDEPKKEGDAHRIEIAMEPAAKCRFEVERLGGKGGPVKGARVGLYPNVVYSYGSTLYGSCLSSEVIVRQKERTLIEWIRFFDPVLAGKFDRKAYLRRDFSAVTNAQGVAVVDNLPARGLESTFVNHPTLVPFGTKPPYRSDVSADLKSGETARVRLQLVARPNSDAKKGEP